MLNSAVWFVTMACNFKCKYCWEVQAQERAGDFKPEKFKKPEEWIHAWNRLRPGILDITGGEPFLQPGLIEIIEAITANGTRMAMTSNFSHPILEFVKRVNPDQLFSITASYHPSENGTKANPMNVDVFLGRMLLLREFKFNVTINIVTWPEQIWLIPKWIELFQDVHKFRVHIDPYSSIEYYPWVYTDAEKAFISKYVTQNRTVNPNQVDPVLCSGGINHLSVQPDGSAWRCILERQQFKNQIGNIFDPNFSLLPEMLRCDQQHVCPGCDRDKVSVYPLTKSHS
jgi:MoaA/NifB/PqqE/SkfB family radical SAM enzyme